MFRRVDRQPVSEGPLEREYSLTIVVDDIFPYDCAIAIFVFG